MNAKELKELLADVPDGAVIFIEADHGQQSQQVGYTYATEEEFEDGEAPYYGEDLGWEDIEYCDVSKITAILIS